jgi:DNA polymerase III sliding clamp (beta) subunit (PCNA family)
MNTSGEKKTMKVQIKDLKNVLRVIKSGLAGGKETTDQSNSFVFQDGMAYTYNDEVSVRVPFLDKNSSGAVGAKELIALVGKLKGEEAEIEFGDNELLIKVGSDKFGIRLEAEIHMPLEEVELPLKKEWIALPAGFDKVLKAVIFSTSKDMSTPILTAIHCNGDLIESTDSDRATRWDLKKDGKYFSKPILLPADAAKSLISYDKIIAYASKGGWIHFDLGDGAIFSCRTFEGKFPDLDPIFKCEGYELEFPADIKDKLEKGGIFVESDFDQEKLVHLNIDVKGVLKIRAEGDSGWYEGRIRLRKHAKEDIQFSINPQHLQQILSSVNVGVIGKDRVLFQSDNFQHVVALEVK